MQFPHNFICCAEKPWSNYRESNKETFTADFYDRIFRAPEFEKSPINVIRVNSDEEFELLKNQPWIKYIVFSITPS